MHSPEPGEVAAVAMADYLVGPFDHEGQNDQPAAETHPGLQAWQVPYCNVALNSLRQLAGHDRLPEGWLPDPTAGAELYRDLADVRKTQRIMTGIKSFVHAYKTDHTKTVLRDDQQELFEDLCEDLVWEGTNRNITAKAATGMGKTVIITQLLRAMKQGEHPTDPVRTLILVPSKTLIGQTRDSFTEFAPEVDTGVYFQEEKDPRQTTIMTYQSFNRAIKSGELTADMIDVIIKDEEHESWGERITENLEKFIHDEHGNRRKLVIGLSATPKETENLAHEKGLLEMIDRQVLSPISARSHKTEATIKEQKRFRKREDYAPEELADLIDNSPRNELIISEVSKGLAEGKRVLVRCLPGGELLHPNMINERLRGITTRIKDPYTGVVAYRPIRSVVIDGKMPAHKRQLLSKAFNNPLMDGSDGLDVLLFVDTLSRGWDSRIAKKIINACPSRSRRLVEQVLGRVTRPFRRMDGSLVYGEAVDMQDITKQDQVLFRDIINSYAPEGQRYIEGTVIGPGMRDMRDKQGRFPAFRQMTEQEIRDEQEAARLAQETAAGNAAVHAPESVRPTIRDAFQAERQHLKVDRIGMEASRTINPFDDAEALTAEPGDEYISLEAAAEEADVSVEDIEDVIMERHTPLATLGGTYYMSSATWRRLRNRIA